MSQLENIIRELHLMFSYDIIDLYALITRFSRRKMEPRLIEKIQNGFTQKELAEKLGVQQPHLSAWFNGRHLPRYETVVKLAGILNYNTKELDNYFHSVYNIRKTKNAKEMNAKEMVIIDITKQLKLVDVPKNSKVVIQIHSKDKVQELSSEVN